MNGDKANVTAEIKASATVAMTVFQTLTSERLKFNEILAGKQAAPGKLNLKKALV